MIVTIEPHTECAQSAQREVHVVGANAQPHRVDRVLYCRQCRRVGRHASEHNVRVAANIFGAGLNFEVDTFLEGAEIKWRRPGVVHQHDRAFVVGDLRDGWNILHLETL